MPNSGFEIVREAASGDREAFEELFVDRLLTITNIVGNGSTPNLVFVVCSAPHGLAVGDVVSILNAGSFYSQDKAVTVKNVIGTNDFDYETLNHTSTVEVFSGNSISTRSLYSYRRFR